jgi:hypothetical protein
MLLYFAKKCFSPLFYDFKKYLATKYIFYNITKYCILYWLHQAWPVKFQQYLHRKKRWRNSHNSADFESEISIWYVYKQRAVVYYYTINYVQYMCVLYLRTLFLIGIALLHPRYLSRYGGQVRPPHCEESL